MESHEIVDPELRGLPAAPCVRAEPDRRGGELLPLSDLLCLGLASWISFAVPAPWAALHAAAPGAGLETVRAALVAVALAPFVLYDRRFAVQASHGDNLHWHALSLCLEFNGVENVRRILGFGDVDALDRASTRLQEFEHGVATLDLFTAETFFVTSRRATRSADVTTHERAPALAW